LAGRFDGAPTALTPVFLRPGANALQVKREVVARMGELAKSFPPGVRWTIAFDTTPYVTESIKEVVKTLFEALLLVTLVVFVFLQSWRATLIPVVAVPVSVIAPSSGCRCSASRQPAHAVRPGARDRDRGGRRDRRDRKRGTHHGQEGVPPAVAADKAMHQVSRALIAIVLVLCSVFIPVAFLGGITGLMYKQFAITIAVSVVLSGIVALTLTPALCAVLLRPVPEGAPLAAESGVLARAFNRFFGGFNRGFRSVTERYLGAAGRVIDRPRTFFAAFAVAVALLLVLVRAVPSGFIPSEDKGYFGMLVELPDNASRQRTEAVVKQVESFLKAQPAINHVVSLVGLNFIQNANQTNAAIMFVMLKPWEERSASKDQLPAVLGAVNGFLFQLQQTRGFAFNLPEIIGLGTTAGLELNLQDRAVNDVTRFAGLTGEFAADANGLPELRGVYPTIRVNTPQLFVQVDREKVKALGISLSELFQTMQASLSTLYINDFNRYGKTYGCRPRRRPASARRPRTSGGSTCEDPINRWYRCRPSPGPNSGRDRASSLGSTASRRRWWSGCRRPGRAPGTCSPLWSGWCRTSTPPAASATRSAVSPIRSVPRGGRAVWCSPSPRDGVPGARGTIRELVDPVRRAARCAVRHRWARCSACGCAGWPTMSMCRSA